MNYSSDNVLNKLFDFILLLKTLRNIMIIITQEMAQRAIIETQRRGNNLNPHFGLKYLDEATRLAIGFLGEFACCEYLGINWQDNIRDNYDQADQYDFIYREKRCDVKTETIPTEIILDQVVNRTINDNVPYGRRLIHEYQFYNNLPHYDVIIFGCFLRPNQAGWNPVGKAWYPIGAIKSNVIMRDYEPTTDTPFGTKYPEPCVNIKTSDLYSIPTPDSYLGN